MDKRKIVIPEEIAYVISCVLLALAVAVLAAVDFGVSMIVAPAYILSLKVPFLTFGQAEYVVQGIWFIALCIIVRRFKVSYLFSFFTCLFYGLVLDLWRMLVPALNPTVTPPGSFALPVRIVLFIFGMLLTEFSVALVLKTYLYPQVYDFGVKAIAVRYNKKLATTKTVFDCSCLCTALIMTLLFFHGIKGIGIGTVIMSLVNGTVIGLFCKLFDRIAEFRPLLPRAAQRFNDI